MTFPTHLIRATTLCLLLGPAAAILSADAPVIVTDPTILPPTGVNAGWVAVPASHSVHYEGTYDDPGLPAPYSGVLVIADSMVVTDIGTPSASSSGTDEVLTFPATLHTVVTTLTTLTGVRRETPLAGAMTVRLHDKVGATTGTFSLQIEAMSFTLYQDDLSPGNPHTPMINVRQSPTLPSVGTISIEPMPGGQYKITSSLFVYSEISFYNPNYPGGGHWMTYYPDLNAPEKYELMSAVCNKRPPVGADLDHSCHVDAHDVELFVACAAGPRVPLTAECQAADLDGDLDADQQDFALLQACYAGPVKVPVCAE